MASNSMICFLRSTIRTPETAPRSLQRQYGELQAANFGYMINTSRVYDIAEEIHNLLNIDLLGQEVGWLGEAYQAASCFYYAD